MGYRGVPSFSGPSERRLDDLDKRVTVLEVKTGYVIAILAAAGGYVCVAVTAILLHAYGISP